ncbi:MAG TPA: hypothetical protein VK781_03180 [Solirubrobacteraceae bacterium]|jgi:hypothetical protein|nr:hypothetical protein [Solirubrobacteraceae bacterium]
MSEPEPTVLSPLTCFVIGPIGNRHAAHGTDERETYEQSLRIMEEVIEPACARLGLTPVRADTLSRAGEINKQIFRRLRDDDVVIADLTGANANVMYELGLRHTRDKLTVQIGEFGRLPFDVNMIRTIQFSSSPFGLISAREDLRQVLEAGLSGEFDPVTATRLWTGIEHEDSSPDDNHSITASTATTDETEDHDFLDIMVESEEQIDELAPALEAIGECVVDAKDANAAGACQAPASA